MGLFCSFWNPDGRYTMYHKNDSNAYPEEIESDVFYSGHHFYSQLWCCCFSIFSYHKSSTKHRKHSINKKLTEFREELLTNLQVEWLQFAAFVVFRLWNLGHNRIKSIILPNITDKVLNFYFIHKSLWSFNICKKYK